MKKECPDFVQNLYKKLTVQISEFPLSEKCFRKWLFPDIVICPKIIWNLSKSGICPENWSVIIFWNMSRIFPCLLEIFMSRICPVLFVQDLSRIFYVWNMSSFICPEFVQNFFMSRICPVLFVWNLSRIFYVWNLSSFICPEFV